MTRRLAVVPDPVLRDGVYIRVSAVMGRADDRFLSPDIQRESIDRARGRGPASRVVDEWRDIDVSTAKVKAADRPGLQQALTAARDHRIDRLWVLTLDRFDRDTSALKTFDEITALGVELWTEAGPLDVETPEGYLSVSMQLAIARYQRDRIGKAWRQTHQHRIDRGLPHSGKPRFGYVYDPARSMHVPDPDTAPLLADAYRRYTAGESTYALVRWLNDIGARTTQGNLWRDDVFRRVLDAGFAAGRLTYGDQEYAGAHEPVITPVEWAAYQAAVAARRAPGQRNVERSTYLLSGLVRCAICDSAMGAGQFGAGRVPKYRCRRGKETGAHAGGYVMLDYLEREVRAWLTQVATGVDDVADAAASAASTVTRRAADADILDAEITALDQQALRAAAKLVEGVLDNDTYRRLVDDITERRADLTARAAAARADVRRADIADPAKVAAQILDEWTDVPVAQRRTTLRRLVARVEVTPGRPRSLVRVVPAWEA